MSTADKVKQVIVARRDLKMPPGKLAAQVAHASMSFMSRGLVRPFKIYNDDPWGLSNWHSQVLERANKLPETEERKLHVDSELAHWLDGPFTKIVVAVDSEEELLDIYANAGKRGLRRSLIADEGRTVFNGVRTHTCVAVGPNYVERVNEVVGHLPLYR